MILTSPYFPKNSLNFGVVYIRPPCAYPRSRISPSHKLGETLLILSHQQLAQPRASILRRCGWLYLGLCKSTYPSYKLPQ